MAADPALKLAECKADKLVAGVGTVARVENNAGKRDVGGGGYRKKN